MKFFNPENVKQYAATGAFVGGIACAVSTIAFFIALDRGLREDPSAGLARVVLAMGAAVSTVYAVHVGCAGGAIIGATTGMTYEAFFGDGQDNSTHLNM